MGDIKMTKWQHLNQNEWRTIKPITSGEPRFFGALSKKLKVFDIVMHTQSSYITAQLSQFFLHTYSALKLPHLVGATLHNEHHHTFYFFQTHF